MKKLFTIALCALLAAVAAEAKTYYVNASRPNNNGNGLSAKTAKKTIQAAINLAGNGDTILVYPGTYAPIKTNNKKIALKSVKGAKKTKIVKSAKMQSDIALAKLGKTYTITYVSSGIPYSYSSGAMSKGKNSVLTGFLLDGMNRMAVTGGYYGISGGTAKACTVQRLSSAGTAAVNASLTACTLKANAGLVADTAVFNRCKVIGNKKYWRLVTDSRLCNCLVVGNRTSGALFARSVFLNCTIAQNLRQGYGSTGMVSEGSKYYNCILRDNISSWTEWTSIEVEGYWDEDGNWIEGKPATAGYYDEYGTYWEYQTATQQDYKEVQQSEIHNVDPGNRYSCTFKDNRNPKFANEAKGNYKLAKRSPCINKGKLTAAQKKQLGSLDLAGGKRVKGKAVDMGCYEY